MISNGGNVLLYNMSQADFSNFTLHATRGPNTNLWFIPALFSDLIVIEMAVNGEAMLSVIPSLLCPPGLHSLLHQRGFTHGAEQDGVLCAGFRSGPQRLALILPKV